MKNPLREILSGGRFRPLREVLQASSTERRSTEVTFEDGKTYLAMALAVNALARQRLNDRRT